MHAAMQAPMLDLLDRLPRQNVRERAKGFGFEEFVVGEELYGTAEIRIGFPGQRGSCFYECISVQQVGSPTFRVKHSQFLRFGTLGILLQGQILLREYPTLVG